MPVFGWYISAAGVGSRVHSVGESSLVRQLESSVASSSEVGSRQRRPSGPWSTDPPDRSVGRSVDLFSAPGGCEQYSQQNSRARRVVALSH